MSAAEDRRARVEGYRKEVQRYFEEGITAQDLAEACEAEEVWGYDALEEHAKNLREESEAEGQMMEVTISLRIKKVTLDDPCFGDSHTEEHEHLVIKLHREVLGDDLFRWLSARVCGESAAFVVEWNKKDVPSE